VKKFARLFRQLDQTTSSNEKLDLMARFFDSVDADTSAWALYFLSGQRPKKLIASSRMRDWAQELTGYPEWLMTECMAAVGDTAETIALILAPWKASLKSPASTQASADGESRDLPLGDWMRERILPLAHQTDEERKRAVESWWRELDSSEIFILNKLITGGLRVGVSETMVYRALEKTLGLPRTVLASRLLGRWAPSAEFYASLARPAVEGEDRAALSGEITALPKPFCMAAPLEVEPTELGEVTDWQFEWKWDGIRCQIVKRGNQLEIWSRGEERITDSFPDLTSRMRRIGELVPGDWIFDGELVAGDWKQPALFQELQKRLGRKKPSESFQKENPVAFLAYDLLRENEIEWSEKPLSERRLRLEEMLMPQLDAELGISELLVVPTWAFAETLKGFARKHGAEGLMIKRRSAAYEVGRKRGVWFKWKVDPFTVDAVLTLAQAGSGRRASLYTDYTFSIWRDAELVPIAKAYSGLTDLEILELDGWIRQHTREKFGPVRSVEPKRVFELGFEGIAESTRNKSGLAVRFPRILRERTDKKPEEADRVETMRELLDSLRSPDAEPAKLTEGVADAIAHASAARAGSQRKVSTKTKKEKPGAGQLSFDLQRPR
jgi:DNA ligase-1